MSNYLGWSSRATWNAVFWLQNTESYYQALGEMVRGCADCELLTTAVARMCHGWWGGMTPDKEPLDDVNWQEIIAALREEYA
jgi:hypothetical protein